MNDIAIASSTGWPRPDTPQRYGTVSRWLHWGMAAGFAFMFVTVLVHRFAEKSAADVLLIPWHKPMGALLMLLVVLRTAWALLQARRRPSDLSAAARWGHRALYLLMIAIPAIALLRQYGSGRAFAPFGLPWMAAREDDKIDWMVELGGLLRWPSGTAAEPRTCCRAWCEAAVGTAASR
jgi:cytochrome b561